LFFPRLLSPIFSLILNTPDNYSYLKIYVKGGWGNQEVFYNPTKMGDITGAQLSAIEEQALTSKVVLIPLEEVRNGYYIGPEFSD